MHDVMRNIIRAVVATAILCVGLLAGCSGDGNQGNTSTAQDTKSDKVEIVCSTFPAYDWVTQVVGDEADGCEIVYLMDNGVDLHSYQPTVEDMARISDADLFVYVGGESDGWAIDAVTAAANPDLHTVNMLEAVGDAAVAEEVIEGMEAEEHDHGHDGDGDHDVDHDDGEAPGYDEHVWLSLRNAQVLVDAIATELSAVDPSNAGTYAANAEAYKAELSELDGRYADAVRKASKDTVVFADRFPFRYLMDDYGLRYHAAFAGCSAETEASFETVAFLARKVDELGLGSVLVIEGSDQGIAQAVVQGTRDADQQVLVMDSLQSATDADIAAGKTYLSVMEGNLATLTTALR